MTTRSLACCPVCYDGYTTERPARILRLCGHDLCDSCIRRTIIFKTGSWQNGSSRSLIKCPTCRAPMISGEQITDYMRILSHISSCFTEMGFQNKNHDVSTKQYQREELAEMLMEELFPKSFSLTYISQKLMQIQGNTGKDSLSNYSTKELIEELEHRLPEKESPLKTNLPKNRPGPLQDIVQQVADTWTRGWDAAQDEVSHNATTEAKTISYVDGIEELSLSMVWLFVLWLFKGARFIYKEVIVVSLGKSGTRAQLFAALQGAVLFAASTWYCVMLLQSTSEFKTLVTTQGLNE